MRKGYLLPELLCVIAIIAVVAGVMDTMFKTFLGDIPRLHRTLNENTYIQNILARMQHDVDAARSLQQEPWVSDPNNIDLAPIIIELPDSTISYRQEEDAVVRRILQPLLPVPSDPNEPDPNVQIWPLHQAKIKWRVWTHDGVGYALEVRTCIEYYTGNIHKDIWANSRVFFPGAHPQPDIKK